MYLHTCEDIPLTNKTAGIRHRQINLTCHWLDVDWFNLTRKMHTPHLRIHIWSYLEERRFLSKRMLGDVLVFASNNCKSGESIRRGEKGRVVSGRMSPGAHNSVEVVIRGCKTWWVCKIEKSKLNRFNNMSSCLYQGYFLSSLLPICWYFIFPQKSKSVL